VTSPEVAKAERPQVRVMVLANRQGASGGEVDLTYSGARGRTDRVCRSRVKQSDSKYVSIYDSFTITVLVQIEDLGFCEKGKGASSCPTAIDLGRRQIAVQYRRRRSLTTSGQRGGITK